MHIYERSTNLRILRSKFNSNIVLQLALAIIFLIIFKPPFANANSLNAKGDLNCPDGSPDCNPCTNSVVLQFRMLKGGQANWKTKPWRFKWGDEFPPYGIKPFDAFDEDSHLANAIDINHAHPQGFVRTNSSATPYAGSHSQHESHKPGTIFVIRQDHRGRKYLSTLHRTHTKHPSGVHILGKYLVFGERSKNSPNELRLLDINKHSQSQDITHIMPPATGNSERLKMFGGGIGIVRLSRENYLLISSAPGDVKPGHRYNQFFHLQGKLDNPSGLRIRYLNEQRYQNPSHWRKDFRYSENLSLITECVSGDIYAIHTTGDGGHNPDALIGGGYWRLSKLQKGRNGFYLKPVDVFEMSQNTSDCHMRSAASVGIAPNGKLEMLCHQYRKDPDPSPVNPFSFNMGQEDKWYFRVGTPNVSITPPGDTTDSRVKFDTLVFEVTTTTDDIRGGSKAWVTIGLRDQVLPEKEITHLGLGVGPNVKRYISIPLGRRINARDVVSLTLRHHSGDCFLCGRDYWNIRGELKGNNVTLIRTGNVRIGHQSMVFSR